MSKFINIYFLFSTKLFNKFTNFKFQKQKKSVLFSLKIKIKYLMAYKSGDFL